MLLSSAKATFNRPLPLSTAIILATSYPASHRHESSYISTAQQFRIQHRRLGQDISSHLSRCTSILCNTRWQHRSMLLHSRQLPTRTCSSHIAQLPHRQPLSQMDLNTCMFINLCMTCSSHPSLSSLNSIMLTSSRLRKQRRRALRIATTLAWCARNSCRLAAAQHSTSAC